MAGIIVTISNVYSEWVDVYKTNAKALLVDIAKIELLSFFVTAVGLGIILALAFALFGGSTIISLIGQGATNNSAAYANILSTITQNLLLFVLLIVPVIIILVLVGNVLGSISLNIIANRSQGKDTSIMENFSANFVPLTMYHLLIWLMLLLILSPIIIAAILGGLAGIAALCILLVVLFLVLTAFAFFTQFALLELIVGRVGVVDSLKRSFALVKENALLVLVFDIVFFFTSLVVGTPLAIIDIFVRLMGNVLMSFGGIAGILLYLFVYLIFSLISGIVGTFFMTTLYYLFWKNISGDKRPDKVIEVSAQIEIPKEDVLSKASKTKAKKTK